MTLSWVTVDNSSKTREGKAVYPSGMPSLSNSYYHLLEEIEEFRAIRLQMVSNGEVASHEGENKTLEEKKTLMVNLRSMRNKFEKLEEWCSERPNLPQRDHGTVVVVEKWPEPEFLEESVASEGDAPHASEGAKQGTKTLADKKRWHHRSRYEAVYERKSQSFDQEKDRRRRMVERNGPVNANMEAIGQRVKSEQGPPVKTVSSGSNLRVDSQGIRHINELRIKTPDKDNFDMNKRHATEDKENIRNRSSVRNIRKDSDRETVSRATMDKIDCMRFRREFEEKHRRTERSRSPRVRSREQSPRGRHEDTRSPLNHSYQESCMNASVGSRDGRHSSNNRRDY